MAFMSFGRRPSHRCPSEPPRSSRATFRRSLLGIVSFALLCGCDSAFSSRGVTSIVPLGSIELSFEDGSTDIEADEGSPIVLILKVPDRGYHKCVDPVNDHVDPDRLAIIANLPIGDPLNGGFAPGDSLTRFFLDQGWITLEDVVDRRVPLHIRIDTGNPHKFEIGFWIFTITILDDLERESEPLSASMSLKALDRPSAFIRAEIPPPDSTLTRRLLPMDSAGRFLLGEKLPFALVVHAFANSSSDFGFFKVVTADGVDPTRFIVTADRDLGMDNGFLAGENLAPLFATDLDFELNADGRELLIGALFPKDSELSPPSGVTTFEVLIVDDDDIESPPLSMQLKVDPAVTLSLNAQPIFSTHCAISFCHGSNFPALGLELWSTSKTYGTAVSVRASQTPEDSCAKNRIEPYLPEATYLLYKVLGTQRDECVKGSGSDMPPGSGSVPENEVELLRQWILQGAHDN